MTKYLTIPGTKGWAKDRSAWSHHDSDLARFLRDRDLVPARTRPFVWSGDLDGIPLLSGNDWEAARESLIYYAEALPYTDMNAIAHSHGGNILLMAAADGLKFRSAILVGTPVRRDIERLLPAALPNIGTCVHIVDARFDLWGLLGALGDVRFSLRRTFLDSRIRTYREKGIGHTGVLKDPGKFALWESRGWLTHLVGGATV